MDKERKKRNQKIRIALTESIMVIAVVVIVALMMFVVMGYNLKTSDDKWGVEQSGLVQLVSTPSGASIEIDGEGIFQRTETSRMMSAGEHEVKLYRDGYDAWSKKITVRSGLFLRLKYPRLFRNERTVERVRTFADLELVSFADNRNSLLYATKGSKIWHLVSLQDDNLREREIDTTKIFEGAIERLSWVDDGEKILAKAVKDDGAFSWWIIDLVSPERSVNLTEKFGMNFSEVKPLNDAADKMWVLENGNLRELYVGSREVSGVLANNVVDFMSNRANAVFVAKTADKQTIGTYRDGDNVTVTIKEVAEVDVPVKAVTEEYLGDIYFSYLVGDKFETYKMDEFPSEGRALKMEKVIEKDLEMTPSVFRVSNNGQFVVMSEGARVVLMDAETEQVYDYTLENERYFWVDDYLIGVVTDEGLVVRDFDGTNRRGVAKASGDYAAIIAVNGKWLYYFTVDENQAVLNREQL